MTGTTDLAAIARRIGAAQKRSILSLSEEWGPAADHRACVRLFYSSDRPLVLHKHQTDNCWSLSELGLALRHHLQELDNAK